MEPHTTRADDNWQVFAIVAVGVFMSTLDSSMVNIALPAIMAEFQTTLHQTEWAVMIYLLTVTTTLVIWGHVSDRIGRRPVYAVGMLLFGASSLLCGLAPGIGWLVGSRFLQATGAAMMMSTGPALVKENSAPHHLGRNLGLIGMSVSLGLMTGPAVAGVLVEHAGWRTIFHVTVPVGLAGGLLARLLLPKSTDRDREPYDLAGILLWTISVVCILTGLTSATDLSSLPLSLLLLGGGAACLAPFLRRQRTHRRPLLPLALFRQRFFTTGAASALLSFAVLFSAIFLMPFFLSRVQELPPTLVGSVMMAIPLAVLLVAPLAGWLSDHIDPRYPTSLGLLLCTASLLSLTTLEADTSPLRTAARLLLLGAGQAMFLSPNSSSVLGRITNHMAGVAGGLLATARNLDMLLGVAVSGLAFTLRFRLATGGLDMKDFTPTHTEAFLQALDAAFYGAALLGAVAVLISWSRGRRDAL